MKIDNLEELLLGKPLGKHHKLVKYETFDLTKPGENYGSVLVRLKVFLRNKKSNEEDVLDLVAKLIHRGEYPQKIFNSQTTFKNEIGFYTNVVPTIQNFLKQNNIDAQFDMFPKFVSARTSLKPENKNVDNDAVLLMENLRESGYQTVDRLQGFDYDSTKAILKSLSQFHAVPLALRLKDPKTFNQNISPYLTDFFHDEKVMELTKSQAIEILSAEEEYSKYLEVASKRLIRYSDKTIDGKWSTIMHNDLWVSNIMLKYQNNKVVDVKFIDFQKPELKSGLRDLLTFLFTSVSVSLLEQHLDEFLEYYYIEFIDMLRKFYIDINEYTRKDFQEQLQFDARESEYCHIFHALYPTYYEGPPINLDETTLENADDTLSNFVIGSRQKEKMQYITKEFFNRGWL